MYQRVYEHDFYEAFKRCDRLAGWSREGLRELYKFLIEMEYQETPPDWKGEGDHPGRELDVVALCCEWNEAESLRAAWEECRGKDDPLDGEEGDEDDAEAAIREYFEDHTVHVEFDGGVIWQAF